MKGLVSEDLEPHTKEWYDRLARLQAGYHFPWRSTLGADNGEDAYTSLVTEHETSTSLIRSDRTLARRTHGRLHERRENVRDRARSLNIAM